MPHQACFHLPRILATLLLCAALFGCAAKQLPAVTGQTQVAHPASRPSADISSTPVPSSAATADRSEAVPVAEPAPQAVAPPPPASEPETTGTTPRQEEKQPAGKNLTPPTECYHLRPASQKADGSKIRCEPQCIPYVRCRSGINSCRLGYENGPLTWFACERKHGNTARRPTAGGVLVLAADNKHNNRTGHVLYIEEAVVEDETTFLLTLSHTNFDRHCSIETGIEARFHGSTMELDMLSGAWKNWARGLRVTGFILP